MMFWCDAGHNIWDFQKKLNVCMDEMVLLRPPHIITQYETEKVWLQTLLYDSQCNAEPDFYKKNISKAILPWVQLH